MHPIARRLVEHHRMSPLPVEATWFVSTYRSPAELADGAPVGTAMLGLYAAATEPGEVPSRSLFHRLAHDEVWHLYGGHPIRLVLLHPDGTDDEVVLGGDVTAGATVQHVIPAGTWQAGELVEGGSWALFGCTMAPGFTGDCFEAADPVQLARDYPDHAALIQRLSPQDGARTMPQGFAA